MSRLAVFGMLATATDAFFSGSGTCSHLLSTISGMGSRTRNADNNGGYEFTSVPAMSSNQYEAGTSYTVTLSKPAAKLNGFLAYASSDGGTTRLGTMSAGTGSKLKDCGGSSSDTVTHQNGLEKTEVTFLWTAPPAGSGDLTMHGIAYDTAFSAFYNPILALTEQTPSPTRTPTNNPTTSNPTLIPTANPTTANPTTSNPTANPTTANPTTSNPTTNPTTANPTTTLTPTANPTTANPTTSNPTANPTTANPTTSNPTLTPTANPTTANPTTSNPTLTPTANPTTANPTAAPNATVSPTANPTTANPTVTGSASPTASPTAVPTGAPTVPSTCPNTVADGSGRLSLQFSDASLPCNDTTLEEGGQEVVKLAAAFAAVPVSDFSCSSTVCVGDAFQVTSDVGGEDPYSVFVKAQDVEEFQGVTAEWGSDVDVPIIPGLRDTFGLDNTVWILMGSLASMCLLCVVCGKLYLYCHHSKLDLNNGPAQMIAKHNDVEMGAKDESESESYTAESSSHASDVTLSESSEDESPRKKHHHAKQYHKKPRKESSSHSSSGGSGSDSL